MFGIEDGGRHMDEWEYDPQVKCKHCGEAIVFNEHIGKEWWLHRDTIVTDCGGNLGTQAEPMDKGEKDDSC